MIFDNRSGIELPNFDYGTNHDHVTDDTSSSGVEINANEIFLKNSYHDHAGNDDNEEHL